MIAEASTPVTQGLLDTSVVIALEQIPVGSLPLDPLPLDAAAARAYGLVYAATRARERKPCGARAVDLFIAAIALANDLPLFTRNPGDVDHLGAVGLEVRTV